MMKRKERSAFAKQLKSIRYRLCFTQEELAEYSNISLGNLKQWETDKVLPNPNSYWELRDELKQLLIKSTMSISIYETEELLKALDIAYKNIKSLNA